MHEISALSRRANGEASVFRLEDLDQLGIAATKTKVVVNCLVKLGLAELQGSAVGGMVYALKV